MPTTLKALKPPIALRARSKQAVALLIIEEQYVQKVSLDYTNNNRMFDILPEFFIDKQLIQALYNVYIRKDSNSVDSQQAVTSELFEEKILILLANQEYDEHLDNLIDELNRITLKVFELYDALRKKKAEKTTIDKRTKEAAATTAAATSITRLSGGHASNRTLEAARRGYIRDTVKASAIKATIRRRAITNAQS